MVGGGGVEVELGCDNESFELQQHMMMSEMVRLRMYRLVLVLIVNLDKWS